MNKIETRKTNFKRVCASVLFFLMLFFPTVTEIKNIKIGLIFFLVLMIIYDIFSSNRTFISKKVFVWILIWMITGLFFLLIGIVHNNTQGIIQIGTFYFLWPLIYLIFISGCRNKKSFFILYKIIIISSIIINLYAIYYVFSQYGFLPILDFLNFQSTESGIYFGNNGEIAYSLVNISTLVFTIPFILSVFFLWPKNLQKRISWPLIMICLFTSFIAALLARRNALYIEIIFSLIIIFFIKNIYYKEEKTNLKKYVLVFIFSLLILYMLIEYLNFNFINSVFLSIKDAFDFSGKSNDFGATLRYQQFKALINGWKNHVFLGAGLNSGVSEIVRSDVQKWAYELTYVALLYQMGVIGICIFTFQIIWIIKRLLQIMKDEEFKNLVVVVLVGLLSFLLANATNPYLMKFDYLWVLFLPLSIINYYQINNGGNYESTQLKTDTV
ncbi:hypothetical protein [Eubacterium sp. 1001713B170207_170306_E7]|uniref:hypothetical protein n=1 Tax=Eubacterium sp. 1001713B170207_170306_E7 TaxID=2787097 RepID=UPI001899751B|nr:hypothetical protein [Eubacterium sp. 1001713B170207_170306_E7]